MALALEGTPVHVNGSGTSINLPAFTTTQGAQIFLCGLANGTTISSVSGGGLTWTLRARASDTATQYEELWTAQASGALSSQVITVNFTGSSGFATYDLFAFSGQDTSTIFDSNASVPATSSNSIGADPVLISTSNANDVIICGFRMVSTPSPTAGSGFTAISGADYQMTQYKIVAATQTNLSCGLTTGSGNSNGCLADALMAAAGGGTRPVKMAGEWGGYAGSSGGFAG